MNMQNEMGQLEIDIRQHMDTELLIQHMHASSPWTGDLRILCIAQTMSDETTDP